MNPTRRSLLVSAIPLLLSPRVALSGPMSQASSIYQALFAYFLAQPGTPRVLVIEEFAPSIEEVLPPLPAIPEANFPAMSPADKLKGLYPAATETLRTEFLRILARGGAIDRNQFAAIGDVKIVWLSRQQKAEIFDTDPQLNAWEQFHTRFPQSKSLLRITLPAIDLDRQTALLYLGWSCGGTCGGGSLFLFAHVKGGWRLMHEQQIWVA